MRKEKGGGIGEGFGHLIICDMYIYINIHIPPTLGVTFDLGTCLYWRGRSLESRQCQLMRDITSHCLGGLGRTVRLRDRLQGGEKKKKKYIYIYIYIFFFFQGTDTLSRKKKF